MPFAGHCLHRNCTVLYILKCMAICDSKKSVILFLEQTSHNFFCEDKRKGDAQLPAFADDIVCSLKCSIVFLWQKFCLFQSFGG